MVTVGLAIASIRWTSSAAPMATAAPRAAPPKASDSQWALRYTRLSAIDHGKRCSQHLEIAPLDPRRHQHDHQRHRDGRTCHRVARREGEPRCLDERERGSCPFVEVLHRPDQQLRPHHGQEPEGQSLPAPAERQEHANEDHHRCCHPRTSDEVESLSRERRQPTTPDRQRAHRPDRRPLGRDRQVQERQVR